MIGTAFHQEILKRLSELGPFYIVGGAVRDAHLGIPFKDVDAVTALPLREIEKKLSGWGYVPHTIGAHLQTVSLFSETERLDIAPLCGEVEKDARRRDFTINAIFQDVKTEKIIDPLGGLDDLRARRLKACGRAEDRFAEDPLRILRLVRLAVGHGFLISQETWLAAAKGISGLRLVAAERITQELARILVSENIERALDLLDELGYWREYIPELARLKGLVQNRYHIKDAWEHTRQVVKNTPSDRLLLRLAALFQDLGKCQFLGHEGASTRVLGNILPRFRWSMVLPGGNKGERDLEYLVEHHMLGILTFQEELKTLKAVGTAAAGTRFKNKARRFAWDIGWDGQAYNRQRAEDLLDLWYADFHGGKQVGEEIIKQFENIQKQIRKECLSLSERQETLDWVDFSDFSRKKGLAGANFGLFKEQVRRRVMLNARLSPQDINFLEQEYSFFMNRRAKKGFN